MLMTDIEGSTSLVDRLADAYRDLATAYHTLLDRGATVVRPPRREPWGLNEMWIVDPDGLRIATARQAVLRRRIRLLVAATITYNVVEAVVAGDGEPLLPACP